MFKKFLLPVLSLAFLFPLPALAQEEGRDCGITIEFGSYTQTIDAKTYAKIMERITKTPEIVGKHVSSLGSQGERTLCLTLAENADGMVIYEDLKRFIPPETKEGWERITLKNGPSFQSELTKKFTPYSWEND